MSEPVPGPLAAAVRADLTPVRRLPPPWRRALKLSPVAALTLIAATAAFALRGDAPALGWTLTWGISIVQALFALSLIALALRESVPGRSLAVSSILLVAVCVLGFSAAATYRTWHQSGTVVPAEAVRWVGSICLTGTVVSAFPLLAAAALLTSRALPVRPWSAGVLYGLGAGLGADAGWRLFCHYSDPMHVLSTHTGGVLVTVAIGVLAACLSVRGAFSAAERPRS